MLRNILFYFFSFGHTMWLAGSYFSNRELNLFSPVVEAWSHADSLPSEPPGKPLNHPTAREFPEVLVF